MTVKEGVKATPALADELKEHVVRKIGAIARPDQILFAADLPKTRSGKIMRRLLRDIAEGKALGDTTTLADPAVVAKLKNESRRKNKSLITNPRNPESRITNRESNRESLRVGRRTRSNLNWEHNEIGPPAESDGQPWPALPVSSSRRIPVSW